MFQFLGSLFGSAKAGERIVDGAINAVDKLFYTDEEKAEAAASARSEGFKVYMAWLESTSGSRLARRFIALIVVMIWASEHLASVLAGGLAVFATDPVKWERVSVMLAGHASDNNALVGVVLLFYFGGPAATDAARGLVEKWVGKKP
ncbi:MAG: hypothetical protein H6981_07290 [Gammaproteobacteria bacterium]|nr:hypothetical protein [Gammaproteobacteria bacterium]